MYMTADCKSKRYTFSDITSYLKGKAISEYPKDTTSRKAEEGQIDWMVINSACKKDLDDYETLSVKGPKDLASSVQKMLREYKKKQGTPF